MPRTRTRFDFVLLANQFAAASDDALLPSDIASAGCGYSSGSSLDVYACTGGGPPYLKRNGGRRLYRKADVLAWLAQRSQRVCSTSEYRHERV